MTDFALKAVFLCGNLIANKIRNQMVFNLTESDLSGQRLRDFIIKPLDDIKEKLDGMARVELKASVNYLEQGMNLLHEHIDLDSKNQETEAALVKRLAELRKVNFKFGSETVTTQDEDNSFIKVAQEKFDESAKCAVKAISNSALELSDRVFATRLNIIATILRHIDNLKISLALCKSILDQLNSTGEIINNCKLQFGKAKGAVTSLKKKLNNDGRIALIQSVANINRMVWNYAHFCQADDSYFTSWPVISLDSERKLHPVLNGGIREICGEREIIPFKNLKKALSLSATESGTFLVVSYDPLLSVLKISPNGLKDKVCCVLHEVRRGIDDDKRADYALTEVGSSHGIDHEKFDFNHFRPTYAVSVHDKLFVLSSRKSRDDIPLHIEASVHVYNSDGSFKCDFGRAIFTTESILSSMALNGDNELLVADDHTGSLHAFKLDGTYLEKRTSWEENVYFSHIAVTPDNLVYKTHGPNAIIRINGRVKTFVTIPKCESLAGIAYDSARQKLLVLAVNEARVLIYDKDFHLEGEIKLSVDCKDPRGIAVTPTGFVAIITEKSLIEI